MPYTDPDKQAKYQREWIAQRRAEWFAGKSCAWCGSAEELQLDHVDPATKVSHRIWSWSDSRRNAELAKCQVLCRPCHEQKAISMLESPSMAQAFRHGTGASYLKRHCKCVACRAWNSERVRRWRARQHAQVR